MKVLFILDSLNRGGAEMWALDVCRNAKADGIDLAFAATGGGTLEQDFRNSGVEFFRFNRRKPIDFSLIRQLRKLIRCQDIDIIHSNQAVEGIHAWLAAFGLGVKHVLSFHGHIPDAKNRWMLRFLYFLSDINVVGTHEFKTWLAAALRMPLGRKCKVVNYGVDEGRLQPGTISVRTELGLSVDDILCGMIGNFYAAPRKDHMTVCRALPAFFNDVPNAQFIFVYAGGQSEDMSKLADCIDYCREAGVLDRVHFAGDRFAAKDVLQELDISVLSTLHESFGIVVVEAMLLGKPCVLSDIPPLIEVSDSGKCAAIFKRGDADDLAEKLTELAQDANYRSDLAAKGQLFARKNFSIEANLASLKALYKSLVRK